MGCTFKGYNLDDYGVIFEKMPVFKKPKRRADVVYVDNRDGFETNELGYDGYLTECIIVLTEPKHFDFVKALLDGPGQLIRNDDPLRYINAKVQDELEFQEIGYALKTTFNFSVEHPFRYLLVDFSIIITTFPNTITNNGNVYSRPYLTLIGSGNVSIMLNGTAFSYNFPIGEDVEIDCESMDAYHNGALRNQYMNGYFPRLNVGSNAISVTGSLTSIKFEDVSRWL